VDRGGHNPLYLAVREFGWQRFTWKPILITNNHMINYLEKNPGVELGQNSLYILRSFTQFESRVIEQAFFSQLRHRLNGVHTVIFPFVNWQNDSWVHFEKDSISLRVESKDRKVILIYPSKNRAAISLGIPNTTLDRYINLQNYPVYSTDLNLEVFLINPAKHLTQDSPKYYDPDTISPISNIDLYALEKGKLFALCIDKETVYGVCDNPSHAALSLDGKSDNKYIRRYISLERPVLVEPRYGIFCDESWMKREY